MEIRKLYLTEKPLMHLLLLADPSREFVEEYINRGECFVAEFEERIIGVYVLLPTRLGTMELVNIAVEEKQHGKGIRRKLLNHAVKNARAQGYKTIEIGTGNSSI